MASRRTLVLLAGVAFVLIAAGGAIAVAAGRDTRLATGRPGRTGCGPVVAEPLDPRSLQHVLPGSPDPVFDRLPPTSGPHAPTVLSGVQPNPLPAAVQVGLLEAGRVLVQYRADGPDRAAVEALVGPLVVVAPAPTLSDPVVATAWRHRLRCGTPDAAAVGSFVTHYAAKGFDADAKR